MLFEHRNYRDFLRASLDGKSRGRNPMSLRAFAQKVGMSNSFLCEVLAGKKALSLEAALKVAVKLELTDQEVQYFCLLVQIEQEQDLEYKEILLQRLQALHPERKTFDLSVDLFRTVSDWYHFAILELSQLTNIGLTPKIASERLGISLEEAKTAIERLRRLELFEVEPKTKRLKKSHEYVLTESHVSKTALRIFHRQVLELAIAALEEQTPVERISSTEFVPIDAKYVPELDRLSREYSKAIFRLTEKSKIKDVVYACINHAFRVSDAPNSDPDLRSKQ